MSVVFTPVFVEFIPDKPEVGKLYISETYATAVHKCACGCGQKVVTPLSPTRWTLTVDDGCVTLRPSIGNWGFPCRSHYYIVRNEVRWSYDMSQSEIDAGRRSDARVRERYYDQAPGARDSEFKPVDRPKEHASVESILQKLVRWLFG